MNNQSSKTNHEILMDLKNILSNECKNITFKTENYAEEHLRKPNESETKRYMISLIRGYHFQYPDIISSGTYYTFKGHIKRGQYEIVNNFIKKHSEFNEFPFLINKYMDSEVILQRTVTVKFSKPITMARIEVSANSNKKGE